MTEEAGEQGAGSREKDTKIRLQKGCQAPKFIYAQKPKYLLCLRHAARTRCIARKIMRPCFHPLNLSKSEGSKPDLRPATLTPLVGGLV
jgi:hypothetical protein